MEISRALKLQMAETRKTIYCYYFNIKVVNKTRKDLKPNYE